MAEKIDRIGSSVWWQPQHAGLRRVRRVEAGRRLPGVVVVSVPSTDAPSATISVWFSVTRIWLLMFVCQFAKNAGVLKKPTRGMVSTSSVAVRSAGRS